MVPARAGPPGAVDVRSPLSSACHLRVDTTPHERSGERAFIRDRLEAAVEVS